MSIALSRVEARSPINICDGGVSGAVFTKQAAATWKQLNNTETSKYISLLFTARLGVGEVVYTSQLPFTLRWTTKDGPPEPIHTSEGVACPSGRTERRGKSEIALQATSYGWARVTRKGHRGTSILSESLYILLC